MMARSTATTELSRLVQRNDARRRTRPQLDPAVDYDYAASALVRDLSPAAVSLLWPWTRSPRGFRIRAWQKRRSARSAASVRTRFLLTILLARMSFRRRGATDGTAPSARNHKNTGVNLGQPPDWPFTWLRPTGIGTFFSGDMGSTWAKPTSTPSERSDARGGLRATSERRPRIVMSDFHGTRGGPSHLGCDVCGEQRPAFQCQEYNCGVHFCERCERIRDALPWPNFPSEVFAQVERVVLQFGEAQRSRVDRVATRLATCEWAHYRDSRK
jgi:hypothetical protein